MPIGPRKKLIGYTTRKPPEPVNEEPRRSPGKKDTKRWCLGKKGREHKPTWQRFRPEFGDKIPVEYRYYVQVCTTCGKHLKLVGRGSLQQLGVTIEERNTD